MSNYIVNILRHSKLIGYINLCIYEALYQILDIWVGVRLVVMRRGFDYFLFVNLNFGGKTLGQKKNYKKNGD